jgi:hypothetical protein
MTANGSPIQTRIPLATSPAKVTLDPDVALLARLRVVPE